MRISDWSSDVCSSDLRGLADRILNLAAGHAAGDWTMAFAAALDHTLSFKALGDLGPERPVMLIGPSGAGKTVTAAKPCACARLAEARSLPTTMDAAKAGGRGQGETFAQIGRANVCTTV